MSESNSGSVPEELRAIAKERSWSEATLVKVARAKVPLSELRNWAWMLPDDRVEVQLGWHERLRHGDLRGRQATMGDNEAFSELWLNSPERIGDWEIITDRSPDAFAQYKLQENVTLSVFAVGDGLVACVGWSRRNVYVAGKRLTVTYGQALRVHDSARRQGYGDQVRRLPWLAAATRPNHTQYDIMRSQNFAVVNWWTKYNPDFFATTPQNTDSVPGQRISVAQLPARPASGDVDGIRPARREDVPRCVELLNRTHGGLDLFRPYSEEFLEAILDEHFWGERPDFYEGVYGWSDYHVLEENGRITACAGLWDRGRNIRERWRHKDAGEERTIADTNLLDWGYESGAEEAMARLVDVLLGRTHRLGRDHLVIGLDHQDRLRAELERFESVAEERHLRWSMPDVPLTRPYTDLRYW
jgi:hypothetical protein